MGLALLTALFLMPMDMAETRRTEGSRGAVITFIAAVLLFSLQPLLVHYSVDSTDVLAFFVVWMLSELFTTSQIIKHLTRSSDTEHPGIRSLWRDNFLANKHGISRPRSKTVILALLVVGGAFDWLLFGVAVENLGPSTATVLYEFWPTLVILGLALRPRNSTLRPRHKRFAARRGLLVCLSSVGVTMVVLSQGQGSHGGVDGLGSAVGLAAAALAALWIVLTIRLSDWQRIGADDTLARMHLSMVVKYHRNLAAALVVAPTAIASLAQSRALPVAGLLLAAAGGAVGAFGDYFLFKANQRSRDPSINALANATPVLALVWLSVLVGVEIPRLDWFVFGTLAVVAANTLLRLNPRGR